MIAEGMLNGQLVRYRMMADGPSTLVLNPVGARKYSITPGWFTIRAKIGPVAVEGRSAVVRYSVNDRSIRRRIAWFNLPFAPGQDGALGPSAVPQSIVTFFLRPPDLNEQNYILPLASNGYAGVGTHSSKETGRIFIQWDLSRPTSLATATVGATLSTTHGAYLSGPTTPTPIRFGITRPVRHLILERTLHLGPLRITKLATRVSDYGDGSRITDADADGSEITVTGKRQKGSSLRSILIGQDAMRGCSSITFDKKRKQIILSCLPG